MTLLLMILFLNPLDEPTELAYSVRGEGKPLLLLPGLGNTSAIWSDLVDEMPPGFQMVLLEAPGVGSGTMAIPFTWDDLIGGAIAVMDRLGHDRFSVAGISWGSFWAQHLALAHNERVDQLILISSTLGGQSHIAADPQVLQTLFFNSSAGYESQITILRLALHPKWCDEHADRLSAMAQARIEHPFPSATKSQQTLLGMTFDMTSRASAIKCPTLILHGDTDQVVPPLNGERLAAAIPGSHLVMIKNSGHVCIIDQAHACAQAIATQLTQKPN